MRLARLLLAVLLFGLLAVPAQAQDDDLGATLEQVREQYGEPYVQPLVDVVGADLNSGLFHTADLSGGLFPLVDVYLGAKFFGAFVSGGDESFDLTVQEGETVPIPGFGNCEIAETKTLRDLPTFFGTDDPGEKSITGRCEGDPAGQARQVEFEPLPGFVQTPVAPLLAPHLEVGASPIGTNLTLRYVPHALSGAYQDYGSIGLFGVGLRHSLDQYIPLSPVSVAAQIMYQNVSVQDAGDDEVVSMTSWAGNIAVSKSLLIATVYGGLQLERAGVSVDYTYDGPGTGEQIPVSFDLSGRNNVRLMAGLSVHPGPIVFNADFSLGSVPVVTAGVGVTL